MFTFISHLSTQKISYTCILLWQIHINVSPPTYHAFPYTGHQIEPLNRIWVTFTAIQFQLRLLQLGFLLFMRPPSAFIDLQKRKQYAAKEGKGMTCMWCEWRWRSYNHSRTLAEVTGHKGNWYGVVAVVLFTPFLSVREARMCSLTSVAWTARRVPLLMSLSRSLIRHVIGVGLREEHSDPLRSLIWKKDRVFDGSVQSRLSKFTL